MNGKSVSRQLVLMAGLVVVAVVAILWSGRQGQTERQTTDDFSPLRVSVFAHRDLDTIVWSDVETTRPLSALQALEQAAGRDSIPLGIRAYDFGKLVVSIGVVTAGAAGHWTYKVNGEFVPQAADAYQMANGDRLEFLFGTAPDDVE